MTEKSKFPGDYIIHRNPRVINGRTIYRLSPKYIMEKKDRDEVEQKFYEFCSFAYSKIQSKVPESKVYLYDFYYDIVDCNENLTPFNILKINLED